MIGADNPPYPTGREPNWHERSSWTMCDWIASVDHYWDARYRLRGYPWNPDPTAPQFSVERQQASLDAEIQRKREEYRRRILGWYRKLCTPFSPPCEVPDEVSRLMYEQWDVDDCDTSDAVNL